MSTDSGVGLISPVSETSSCTKDPLSFILTRVASQSVTGHCSGSLPAEASKLSVPVARKPRPQSAPSDLPVHRHRSPIVASAHTLEYGDSFTASDDADSGEGDWMAPDPAFLLQRAVSVGSKQYGFTSLGRGFNWLSKEEEERERIRRQSRSRSQPRPPAQEASDDYRIAPPPNILGEPYYFEPESQCLPNVVMAPAILEPAVQEQSSSTHPGAQLPMTHDIVSSTLSVSPISDPSGTYSRSMTPPSAISCPSVSRSPTSPRPPSRRRSSHKRVSLVAGRLRVIEDLPPLLGAELSPQLARSNSQSSLLSAAISTRPPSPVHEPENFLGNRNINDYVIEGEAGRGAYGLVKRAREKLWDGKLGPPLIVKQVIKSRILADCWKKHPRHGTIPIEIYVMSSISNTSYVLPPPRPWDPARPHIPHATPSSLTWEEGAVVKGHPNICPLIDFFEDAHFYHLVLPSTSPPPSDGKGLPSDLFDLVELYPQGLPAHLIRSYLGQIADALCFLHSKGIVHRDIKDENVVLGPSEGKCILIDFGSSGIVRKGGWDTFSGTLDYAGPEILRGESYNGKEQDVWAFGVVAFVLLVGECPFMTPTEAQEGLASPFAKARMALDERCQDGHEDDGEEPDGGGRLGDAYTLVLACLQVDVAKRPTFEKVLSCRFLAGKDGW